MKNSMLFCYNSSARNLDIYRLRHPPSRLVQFSSIQENRSQTRTKFMSIQISCSLLMLLYHTRTALLIVFLFALNGGSITAETFKNSRKKNGTADDSRDS
uniref:Uncharacterized protein n=1 Tax=Glossina brevipalpis TaxID=37001 RepID=A0A1A9X1W1_9MUSC